MSSKSIALSSCPCRRIWLSTSIRLDLSASFAIFGSWTLYVFVLMLLMKGYSLQSTGFPLRLGWIWVLHLLFSGLGLYMFLFLCYWWKVTHCNLHIAYQNSPYLIKICNFVFLNHWVNTSADGSCPREYSPAQLSDLSDMKFMSLYLFDLGLPVFCFLCYWWEATHRNVHTAYTNSAYL